MGAKRRLHGTLKSKHTHTHIRTDRHTDILTNQLIESIVQEGRCMENFYKISLIIAKIIVKDKCQAKSFCSLSILSIGLWHMEEKIFGYFWRLYLGKKTEKLHLNPQWGPNAHEFLHKTGAARKAPQPLFVHKMNLTNCQNRYITVSTTFVEYSSVLNLKSGEQVTILWRGKWWLGKSVSHSVGMSTTLISCWGSHILTGQYVSVIWGN